MACQAKFRARTHCCENLRGSQARWRCRARSSSNSILSQCEEWCLRTCVLFFWGGGDGGGCRYCVSAVSTNGAGGIGYTSQSDCEQARVFWESTVPGRIMAKGTLAPVKDALIAWHVPGTNIRGVELSDGTGSFEIHIKDTNFELYSGEQGADPVHIADVHATVTKQFQFVERGTCSGAPELNEAAKSMPGVTAAMCAKLCQDGLGAGAIGHVHSVTLPCKWRATPNLACSVSPEPHS